MDRETFERLNLEEQERVLHQSPFREKGELILDSHDPFRLAQSLSQEEFYLVTREMDLEERSELLRYATLPQLLFISDIDCWQKDRIHASGFLHWLETLLAADEGKLLAWLLEMDYEMIVSGFKGLIQVLKRRWEYLPDELLGDRPYFTLDESYFILVKEENLETVKRVIEILFENHRGRYTALLEGVLGELDYEMEEKAYQKRLIRLAERGFPDPETAQRLYRPISREEYERFPRKAKLETTSTARKASSETRAPNYLTLWSSDRLFLDEVLLRFREAPAEIRENLQEELAWLSNKVIASEGIDFASEERVRRGIERARRIVSLGLEALSEQDPLRAVEILRERWLEILFRWGVSCLVQLREEASRIVETHWRGLAEPFLKFLDDPYESIFRGLFQRVPQCFDPEVRDHLYALRDFKNLGEIEKTRTAVRQVEQIHTFLAHAFPPLFARLILEARRQTPSLSFFSLLGLLFAHFVIQGKVSIRPLAVKETTRFLQRGFENGRLGRRLHPPLKEKFMNEFFSRDLQDLLRPLWALLFQRLEEELGGLDPKRGVDRRFVTTLVLENSRR